MIGWIRRFLGNTETTAGVRAAPAPRPARSPAAPARSTPPVVEPTVPAEPAEDEPFAPFARALGIDVPAPEPEEAEPDPEELALAERVLDHFRKNRPGPASAPSLSLRLLNVVASPRAEVGEMVRLISADAALSAGVLTVANSAAYRGVDEADTVRAAVVRLGLDEVARVAGAVSARSLFSPRYKAELATHGVAFGALFGRALTVATGAATLTLGRRDGRSDRAYLGGILFDVGRSIALRSLLALEAGVDPGRAAQVLERVHVEVGAECHQEWNLPQYLTVIAVRHHDPEIPADAEFAELHAVRLCGALVDLREPPLAARAAREIAQSAGALGLQPPAVRALDAELRRAALRVGTAFGVGPG
jgi:HD-like signal output (HDOD) protein